MPAVKAGVTAGVAVSLRKFSGSTKKKTTLKTDHSEMSSVHMLEENRVINILKSDWIRFLGRIWPALVTNAMTNGQGGLRVQLTKAMVKFDGLLVPLSSSCPWPSLMMLPSFRSAVTLPKVLSTPVSSPAKPARRAMPSLYRLTGPLPPLPVRKGVRGRRPKSQTITLLKAAVATAQNGMLQTPGASGLSLAPRPHKKRGPKPGSKVRMNWELSFSPPWNFLFILFDLLISL